MNNNRNLNGPVNSLVPLGVPGAEMINNLQKNVVKLNNRVNNALNNTANNLGNAANNLGNGVANMANNFGNAANNLGNGVANVANNFGNGVANVANNFGNGVANVANSIGNVANNAVKNVGAVTESVISNIVPNNGANIVQNTAQTGWVMSLIIFGALVFIFIMVFLFFQQQITDGLNTFFTSVRDALGMKTGPPPPPSDKHEVTKPSTPPDQEPKVPTSIAEKMLPTGAPGSEVFAVSKNTFTYYDAQPLCKALGAELATYDQVKAAWDKGADWCNYGWVKGQNAIFPTQTDTWQKLQGGPEEERGACGRPGINGGYFDNPELRFGVNCYGPKPSQSTHDEAIVAKRTGQPLTVGALEVEKKVSKFRSEADNIGVLPFSGNKWLSS
jgi:hypothetical protein